MLFCVDCEEIAEAPEHYTVTLQYYRSINTYTCFEHDVCVATPYHVNEYAGVAFEGCVLLPAGIVLCNLRLCYLLRWST